jgi:tartrate dehydratase alpha subunit/fumarate hydratase class I-like protein
LSIVRDIDVAVLRDSVARLIVEANYNIPADILDALRSAVAREESPLGRRTLEQLVRNYEVAATERVPVCQDGGVAVVFLEIGQDVPVGGSITDAVHAGFAKERVRIPSALRDRRSTDGSMVWSGRSRGPTTTWVSCTLNRAGRTRQTHCRVEGFAPRTERDGAGAC